MDNRGGTSIDELMRQPNNSNISEDESMVQSILLITIRFLSSLRVGNWVRHMKV